MVELLVQRGEGRFDVRKIHHPPKLRVGFAKQMDFDAKRVTVQPRALMPLGNVGQTVRGFDLENLEDMHAAILTGPTRTPSGSALCRANQVPLRAIERHACPGSSKRFCVEGPSEPAA